ncbi:hypothetical protein IFR05_011057 [Cadophora sp. M221]|nr:hypothetical protein IFR05_011057 [Cadophora sp. M221]
MATSKSPTGASLKIYIDCGSSTFQPSPILSNPQYKQKLTTTIVSPYSWFGITNILKHRPGLVAHGVNVDIQPFFLGGARDAVGNFWQPTPKWKEAFAAQDTQLNGELLGLTIVQPEEFPIKSLFPVRVATYIKDNYPDSKFEATFLALVSGYWSRGINISQPAGLIEALSPLFTVSEIEEIMKKAVEPANKQRVIETTKESGAFGAPWIICVDSKGDKKSWFGNDRWDQIFAHLGVPYEPVHVVMPKESKL